MSNVAQSLIAVGIGMTIAGLFRVLAFDASLRGLTIAFGPALIMLGVGVVFRLRAIWVRVVPSITLPARTL